MKTLFLLFITSLLFVACSQKSYYQPKEDAYASLTQKSRTFSSHIINLSRDGATLSNGNVITQNGIHPVQLGKGFRFLTQSGHRLIASHPDGTLKVMHKKSGKIIRKVEMHSPIVSATIKGNLIAYVLSNNAFGLYNIYSDEKLLESRSDKAYAIDTRTASPIFIESLAIMPMLDGKLVIVDTKNVDNTKIIYLSNALAFNNVIHLSRVGNTMIAATPKKLSTISVTGKEELDANIFDVVLSKGAIYLFTKSGTIKRLNLTLQTRQSKHFPYANFAAVAVTNHKVYALDITGSLIVANRDLTQYRVYDVGEVEHKIYMDHTSLYKDGEIINLEHLHYQ
jgi:hypothetical protein